jgi:2-methylisocitrate lyase-like PEP mutase family enzyme
MSNDHATAFRALHAPGQFLILANAWDAGSARIIESCGAAAIATSSAAVAWACGYPDGNALPVQKLLAVVESIERVISVPLTVDAEGGYSSDPAQVGETIFRIASAGGVGINLEDGAEPPDLLCAKIEAAKRGARKAGVDLFVNARIDVLLRGLASSGEAVEAILSRAARYRDAGCDGIFVPLISKPDDIRTVANAIDPLPLNVMAVPALPSVADLGLLGARRLSAGAAIARAAISLSRQLAEAFMKEGRSQDIFEAIKDTTDVNALFLQD